MKRLGGPQLKLSRPRVPGPVADVYGDLRDRHLLPLVALILVAIVATPILLGSDSEPVEGDPAAREASRSLRSAAADAPALTVVEAEPGVRDYRERLRGRSPDDPFKQHHAAASLQGAKFGGGGGQGSGSGADTTSTSVSGGAGDEASVDSDGTVSVPPIDSGGEGSAPGSGGNGSKPRRRGLVFYDWAINVRLQRPGPARESQPVVRERVLPQTPLPGEKAPLVTYMGAARDGKKINGRVLLLISDRVREVASDGRCVSGEGVCQLLEVTPGFPVALTYGEAERKLVVNVNRLYLAVIGRR